jgi:NAD-reducing hydrogenase small subunit
MTSATRPRIATVWLDGCSGCHMSFLDLDERLIELSGLVDVVYTPLIDTKEYPEQVDVVLVEGAVGSEEDLEKLKRVRERTEILVSFGDCAVNGNVPSYRNMFSIEEIMGRAYLENVDLEPRIPDQVVPRHLPRERPIHEHVKVDIFLQGCPPPADTIYALLKGLVEGNVPDLTALTRFGR